MTSPIIKTRLRRVAAVGVAVVLCSSLAACGSGKTSGKQNVVDGGALAPLAFWPLTGESLGGAKVTHPVMAVKVPNTPDARPQIGLSDADMVSEELVEGGITRLAVYFDKTIPAVVGPVRSMRETDVGLVKPTNGILFASGAARETINALSQGKQPFVQEDGTHGFYRERRSVAGRVAPYNLMDRLSDNVPIFKLGAPYPDGGVASRPTQAYFDFASGTTPLTGAPATSIQVRFSGYRTTKFAYDAAKKTYTNTNGFTAAGQEFLAQNVIVLRVLEDTSTYRDPAGNPVPITNLASGGTMTLFRDGVAVQGKWKKAGLDKPFVFTTVDGTKTLQIPTGRTYLELCPVDASGGGLTFN